MMRELERQINIFGTEVTVLIGDVEKTHEDSPHLAAISAEALLRAMQTKLTRFEDASELSVLNRSRLESNMVSRMLARAVSAALWAAEFSNGLFDPTIIDAVERNGYGKSLVGVKPASLVQALSQIKTVSPAKPNMESRWREIHVNGQVVSKPVGVRIDLGGIGKGLAADLLAARLETFESYVADVGGDIRLGGTAQIAREILIESPLDRSVIATTMMSNGAVATSGIGTRIWKSLSGFQHHIVDPSTGHSAWTGVVQATAFHDSSQVAETLAKMALMMGPEQAREILATTGGVLVTNDGNVELFDGPDTFMQSASNVKAVA